MWACGVQLQPVMEAVAAGMIEHVGLSNCTLEQLVEAAALLPPNVLASVQNKYPFHDLKQRAQQQPVLEYCEQNGLAYLPWGDLPTCLGVTCLPALG